MQNTEPTFKKKSLFRELNLNYEERKEYYKEKRAYNYDNNKDLIGFKMKKAIHPALLKLIELQRKIVYNQTLTIIGDKRKVTNKPIIYACTHGGIYDIEIVMEAIKKHAYMLMGDPETVYRTINGYLSNINGIIYIDLYDKEDKKIAMLTAERLLNQGGSLLMFPEGAWNITENEAVMKLFPGTVNLALKTGAEIVPIALEHYGNDYYLNIGENISYDKEQIDAKELTKDLRDILATLKWSILENFTEQRGNLPDNYSEIFIKDRMKDAGDFYNIQRINDAKFKNKNEVNADEVFAINITEKPKSRILLK